MSLATLVPMQGRSILSQGTVVQGCKWTSVGLIVEQRIAIEGGQPEKEGGSTPTEV